MTREEARQAAKVLQAYADGKTVQCKQRSKAGQWQDLDATAGVFNWTQYLYRIKPEPRVVYVCDYGDGIFNHNTHESRERARECSLRGIVDIVKFVEATD